MSWNGGGVKNVLDGHGWVLTNQKPHPNSVGQRSLRPTSTLLTKRRLALQGRNLPRDSQASDNECRRKQSGGMTRVNAWSCPCNVNGPAIWSGVGVAEKWRMVEFHTDFTQNDRS